MDRIIARELIEKELSVLRKLSYGEWLQRIDRVSTKSISGPDGKEYQVEIQPFWDSKKGGNIRVLVSLSSGGLSDFIPMSGAFIISPSGTFVGEGSN